MAGVVTRARGEHCEIIVSSNANRDLGIFLVFLGVVGTVPVHYMLDWLGYTGPQAFYAGSSGFVCVLIGFAFIFFSKKRFVVSPQDVSVQEGFLRSAVRYRWESSPSIRLRGQEEQKGNRNQEFWLVNLIDGKRQYVLDKRLGHQMESRCLAEALAKAINCPVIERADHGDVTIPRQDLDLHFAERVRRNPSLLGPEVSKPESSAVVDTVEDGELQFSWALASAEMLSQFLTVVFLVGLLALVPLFPSKADPNRPELVPERLQRSYFDLAREDHKFNYFFVTGACLGFGCFFLFGYHKELRAGRKELRARDRLWGIPVWQARIPVEKLEEIWVRQGSQGTYLQFISDDCIITGRTASVETAAWLASKIRHYYAKG